MKVNSSVIKNIIAVSLVILCVFQTLKLWFGDSSIRELFYSFSGMTPQLYSQEDELKSLTVPYRIISGGGANRFDIIYTELSASPQKRYGDEAIAETLLRAEFIRSAELDFSKLLQNERVLIYEYKFQMPSDSFVKVFKQKPSFLTGKLKQFNQIFIIPGMENSGSIHVVFVDIDEKKTYEYLLSDSGIYKNIIANINFGTSNSELYYTSSVLSAFDIFSGDYFFIAGWEGEDYSYNAINRTSPFGDVLLSEVERQVKTLFDNPSVISSRNANEVFTYTDEYTVVKYHPSNVLEYTSYRSGNNKGASSFDSSYIAAMNIMRRDGNIGNEFYLSGYKLDSNNKRYNFYFDYSVENLPIFYTAETLSELGISNAIEVTVENNQVLKYKRYVVNFARDEGSVNYAKSDFISSIENIMNPTDAEEKSVIDELLFGYKVDKSEQSYLSWYINIGGHKFMQSAN